MLGRENARPRLIVVTGFDGNDVGGRGGAKSYRILK